MLEDLSPWPLSKLERKVTSFYIRFLIVLSMDSSPIWGRPGGGISWKKKIIRDRNLFVFLRLIIIRQ